MPTNERLVFYYNRDDLAVSQNLQRTNLHEDKERLRVKGRLFFVFNFFEEIVELKKNSWDMLNGTIYLNDNKDSINFNLNLYNDSVGNKFLPGTYIAQIVSGCGKYVGARGRVRIIVDEVGSRTLVINVTY
jgi:hypothetical protein